MIAAPAKTMVRRMVVGLGMDGWMVLPNGYSSKKDLRKVRGRGVLSPLSSMQNTEAPSDSPLPYVIQMSSRHLPSDFVSSYSSMKKIPSVGMALLSMAVMIPSAFAATAVPTSQPNNGFVQAANPEWTAAHQTSVSNIPGHREYHRNAEVTLLQWYASHAIDRATAAYNAARRVMLQTRNMLHRQFHAGTVDMNNNTSESSSSRSSVRSTSSRLSISSSSVSSSRSSISSSPFINNVSSRTSSSLSPSSQSSSSMSSTSNSMSSASTAQNSVSLGAASTFAVLAGSTVTNTGMTTVTGDLGVSPGTAVTGFGPGVITGGSMHKTDTAAANAESALTVTYNDLAGRTLAPVSVSGNLGGMTLSPGLYKSTSSVEISSGELTLDAKGNANAIFIFQIASTLDVSTGRSVVLIGGAKASNVYWQVGTSATINANAVFKGSILADQSIAAKTGANIEGRLLARIGAVTLQGNTVTVPAN